MAQMTTTPVRTQGFYLQGKWIEEGTPVEIRAPYDGTPIAQVFQATREHVEKAIQAAVRAFGSTRRLPAFERQRVLRSIAQHITSRKEEFARTLAQEAGKPLKAARTEVERAHEFPASICRSIGSSSPRGGGGLFAVFLLARLPELLRSTFL